MGCPKRAKISAKYGSVLDVTPFDFSLTFIYSYVIRLSFRYSGFSNNKFLENEFLLSE